MDVSNLTIAKLHKGLTEKQFSALEVTEAYLKSIEAKDGEIGAYLHVDRENALVEAEKVDVALRAGEEIGPLAGVPMGIKDAILVRGMQATAGSKILEHYEAAYDATAISRLRKAGAVFLGKTNLDEFAMGSSTEHSAYKKTKNPHNITCVPGGSSGGSAAAVAGDMALAALGSDTGGSIRQPAAFCGVVGLKTTYGSVSRHGLIALASSLDQIGPFTKTVHDAELVFNAMRGSDHYDATSVSYSSSATMNMEDSRRFTVGIPEEYFGEGMDESVRKGMESVVEWMKQEGIQMKSVSLPHTKYALSTYYIVLPAEASSNLARYDGVRFPVNPAKAGHGASGFRGGNLLELYKKTRSHGFGEEVKRRIILGTFVLSSGYYDAYYTKAQKVRALIKQDFIGAFKEVDMLLTPVTPTPAFKFGEKTNDPLQMYLSDMYTIPANLAGVPGISIPIRNESRNLPIGFQLIGKPWREADLFEMGKEYERAMGNK